MSHLFPILLAALVACSAESSPRPDPPSDQPELEDLSGTFWRPLAVKDAKAHVLIFITTDCPIANGYAPEIRAIRKNHAQDPFRWFLVHVDPDVTAEDARRHRDAYGHEGPVLRDLDHALVSCLGITITPEVAVVLTDGTLAYRGRIDDWYGDLGRKRPSPTTHDLRDALAALLEDRPVPTPRTQAIGCDIPRR